MNRVNYLLAVLVLGVWLVGCGTGTPSVEPTVEPVNTPTTIVESASPTVEPTPIAESEPTAEPTAPEGPVNPLAGIIYQDGQALYVISADGTPEMLFDMMANSAMSTPKLSPDLTQAVYVREDDLWLTNLESGESRQLTDTPDIVEREAIWWPARPGVLLYNYIPLEEMGPWQGYLAALDLDSGESRILDDEMGAVSPPAPSPDGQSIAYERSGQPWLYRWGQGAEPLALASQLGETISFVAPAWSPDGSRLAWKVYGSTLVPNLGGESQSGVALFDLAAQTVQLLHPYAIQGGSEIYAVLEWSPTGEWLAVMNQGEVGRMVLWVMRPDGSEEQQLGTDGPVWSPDGQFLIYHDYNGSEPQSWLVEAGVWEAEPLSELPPGSFVQEWVALQ